MSESPDKTEGSCEVCQKIAKRKCSACKLAFYCSLEHQQNHWKTHKVICQPYEINYSGLLGRYLRATRDLKPGDIIFSETPLIFGPKTQRLEDGPFPCVGCCKLLYDQTCDKCPSCCWPVCNLDCPGLKLPYCHGFECNVLKLKPETGPKSFFNYYRFDILIILRALYLQKYNVKKWKRLLELVDHMKYRGPGSKTFKIIDEKVKVLEETYFKPLRAYEKANNQIILQDTSSNLIHSIYGILDVNAIELAEETDALILYSTASMLEHDCSPNTLQIIDEKNNYKITLKAALAIREDNHITNTYTNILWGTRARREHLKETKYFICSCSRCRDPTELGTMFSALKCMGTEQEACGGIQLPLKPTEEYCIWQCDKCKIQLPDEEVMKFVNHLNSEVDKVLAMKPRMAELEDIMNKLLVFLHPHHYLIYNIKHTLVQLYGHEPVIEISTEFLKVKLDMCQELIDLTRKIDPGCARLSLYMGVLLNEQFIGKFKLLLRVFEADRKNEFISQIRDISRILDDNKKVLQCERNTPSGSKLYEVVCNNDIKFKNWMNENCVICEEY